MGDCFDHTRPLSQFQRMGRSSRSTISVWTLALICAMGGCVSPTALAPEAKDRTTSDRVRLVLMPPDLMTYELTTGGLLEPRAQWTRDAEAHLISALEQALKDRGIAVVSSQLSTQDSLDITPFNDLWKLQEIVARTILTHHYKTALMLPTKGDTLDWSLGSATTAFHKGYEADYALFVYLRDSYTSPGRMALKVLAAGLYLNPFALIPGSAQFGYGMLIDLHDGQVLWFHRYHSRTGGLREADEARATVEDLLSEFPL